MVASAPGRINIIGEHVDYNDGYVLPFAIDKRIFIEVEPSEGFIFESEGFRRFNMKDLVKTGSWPDYIIGVIKEIEVLKKIKIPPLKFRIHSEVPVGMGLSSSAALETAATYGISKALDMSLSKEEIFKVSVNAERNFVGVKCGIMDQYTAVFAKEGYALLIDAMNETHEYIKMNLKEHVFAVIDSKVKHSLVSGEYNKRRAQAEKALKLMEKASYREVRKEDVLSLTDPILKKRALHIVEEIERTLKAAEALKNGNIDSLGKLLYESHESLSKNYEVSCRETDFIVAFLKKEGIKGARMVGGGFGGGVIVLSKMEEIAKAYGKLKSEYNKHFGLTPDIISLKSSDGVRLEKDK